MKKVITMKSTEDTIFVGDLYDEYLGSERDSGERYLYFIDDDGDFKCLFLEDNKIYSYTHANLESWGELVEQEKEREDIETFWAFNGGAEALKWLIDGKN